MLIFKILALFFIISNSAFAGKAVVIVLEAPLLRERTPKAKVLQLVRKNNVIWIRDRDFSHSPLKPNYNVMNDSSRFDELKKIRYENGESKAGYFETMDRNGNVAFIKKSHVKLLYKDDRESLTNVNPFIKDPTDYRLEEPLPSDYPLTDPVKRRAFVTGIFGPALKQNFQYADKVKSTDQDFRKGMAFGYSGKVNWDDTDRFYFGGYGHFLVSESSFTFQGNELDQAEEVLFQLALGPFLSYDTFRTEGWKLSVGGGINLNFTRHFVKLKDDVEGEEERLFQGFNFSPRFFSNLHFRNFVIPNLDLIFGLDMQLYLAQTYSNNGPQRLPALWERNENPNSYISPTGAVFSFLVGIQSNY